MAQTTRNTIVITGCSRGIGRGLTRFFCENGFRVAGIDVDRQEAETLRNETSNADAFEFFHGSVDDEAFLKTVYQSLADERVTGLVNNAAHSTPYTGPIEELDIKTWNSFISVNLTGAMLNMKYAVPYLRKTRGAIVNMSSTRAIQSEPHSECYAAAKSGLIGITHASAVSLGPDIRVNAIAPGWIDTTRHQGSKSDPYEFRDVDLSQHPAGMVGTPDDIAHLAEYLLSEKSRFVTGQVFFIDGGMTRKMIYEH